MRIKVKVMTGAKKERVTRLADDRLEVSVREEPERNMANARVIALVALHFGIPASRVRIVSGHHRPSKILLIS